MQDESRRYANRLRVDGKSPISIRVGVNTGEVVVRSVRKDADHSDYAPVGHSTGLAERMQALATPGSIAIAESTRKLVEGYFALNALGPTKVKGVSEPVSVYEVTGLGPLRTRLQRSASRGYTKFVGRHREMEAMKAAAEQARAGQGQIVAAMAEAGVGKSRLFFEFKGTSQSGWTVLEAFSVSHGKATPYLPAIDLLQSYFKIVGEDDQRTRRAKVTGNVLTLDRSFEDTLPYLFALLGIVEGDDPLARMDPQIRKRRTLDAIKRILLRESLNRPLMVIFEDLHWIDDETQALLNLLADSIGTAKILLLVNYRPEYTHGWGSKTYYTQLRLDPLDTESAQAMLTELVGDEVDVQPLKRLIIERTQGNPFFMEETVLVLFDEGALARDGAGAVTLMRPLEMLKIPPTVQSILTARIDRQPTEEKALLQTLAVIGMEFQLNLVRAVTDASDDELNRMLSDLQLAEFIYEQPAVSDVEYRFKHALTREVAYNSVLTDRKRTIHEGIARAIEELFSNSLEDHLGELAHHYSNSGNRSKAVHYLTRAADQTAQRAAFAEATRQLAKALQILQDMPPERSRDERELEVQIAMGRISFISEGESSADSARALARAAELATALGDIRRQAFALEVLGYYNVALGELRQAAKLSNELQTLAERIPELQPQAIHLMGFVAMRMGEFGKAERDLTAAAFEWARTPALTGRAGHALASKGFALWALGFPDQALDVAKEALARTDHADHPDQYTRLTTAQWVGLVNLNRGDLAAADDLFHKARSLALQHGFSGQGELSTILIASVSAWRGQPNDLVQICRDVERSPSSSAVSSSSTQNLLARGYAFDGNVDAALASLAKAMELVQQGGEEFELASMHLLKGNLLKGKSNSVEAENSFRTSIEVARRQESKSWELRATTSLARLLDEQGKRDEARTMLAEINGWFTEGFDTADLKDAKALLDELSA